jgi:MFS family permease
MSVLARDRTIAGPGFSRWLIPPAALAVHLSIGQVYAFSVFKTSLVKHFDVGLTSIAWIFSIAIVMLGLSAAFGGTWVERAGPRQAMLLSAVCFSSGLLIGGLGIATERLWLLYLGYGVVGGIGLGIGYISPVSTLIKWFPDRPGLATGLAIMGFGGGALIASPLSNALLGHFDPAFDATVKGSVADGQALSSTFTTLGLIYLVLMLFGATGVRLPPSSRSVVVDHARDGWGGAQVTAAQAIRTPQFALLWVVLFCNVTAGIGILEQAAPMIQDFFRDGTTSSVWWIRRGPVDRQYGRTCRLVLDLGYHRPPGRLRAVPRGRGCPLRVTGHHRGVVHGGVRRPGRRHPHVLRRWVRHCAGLSQRPIRHPSGRCGARSSADRLVGRRRGRATDRQRHPGTWWHPRGSD